ncbi:GH15 family glucan-1,4-alpha-glucosidase [Paraburkholderia sp. RAU2J]|uniref:glycoside hydrolase family 15 protein n=1 Tax=Paraburkholderia sp. RAU2J TaxID=1938810 RepID=UPI000EB07477|nr:glycoside hydrolase family 15 protein [Paraburkholderia sp. RAU2J]RKT14103.1 GH15 family glucan-1,4-alpha-glucosidase [Paraburkholderia sp. RAU2J]
MHIEDYAMIGDGQSAALVSLHASIDWLCWPSFDSDTCFAALLGDKENGCWTLTTEAPLISARRRYRPGTLVIETTLETLEGTLVVTDCMVRHSERPVLLRHLACVRGIVRVTSEVRVRFDYGRAIPWCRSPAAQDGRVNMICGPQSLWLDGTVASACSEDTPRADFTMTAGDRHHFSLTCADSCEEAPPRPDADRLLADTVQFWIGWSAQSTARGRYADAVSRSLITLEALSDTRTGGIAAAPSSSLPERPGSASNWDYRFCWLRDAAFTMSALLGCGYHAEAARWRDWLVRAIAGHPAQLQVLYALDGSRRLDEWTCPWLPGYRNSTPVRFGNAAVQQSQLDVYGEVLNALYLSRRAGLTPDDDVWSLEVRLIDHLQKVWREPDDGIWEVRDGARQFTFSKVMAWVAVDRALSSAKEFGKPAPVAQWLALADEIREDVLARGYDERLKSFTQSYGSERLDASCLLIPVVGFLPIDDPRVAGTVAAIEANLMCDGLVLRYREVDGEPGPPSSGERPFLACSFWLVHVWKMQGRCAEAHALFERLLSLRNDVGLLSEKYDEKEKCLVGNFPQALSHVSLINAALCLDADINRSVPD